MSGYDDSREDRRSPLCGTTLFLLLPAVPDWDTWGMPGALPLSSYAGPQLGPWSPTCKREPHPEGTWHWRGRTWWR